MCIIAASPKKASRITKEIFKNMWNNNPDGGGIMYAEDGILHIEKELKSWKRLYRKYVDVHERGLSNVLHFRIGTSGSKNEYNIHPFSVNKELAFCHNGILSIQVPVGSLENDTQIFNNAILKRLRKGFINDSAIRNLIELAIGMSNKFVFMDNNGEISFINEAAGNWKDGIWFSNYTYSYSYSTRGSSSTSVTKPYATTYGNNWRQSRVGARDVTSTSRGLWDQDTYGDDDWDEVTNTWKPRKWNGIKFPCDSCGVSTNETEMIYTADEDLVCEECYMEMIEAEYSSAGVDLTKGAKAYPKTDDASDDIEPNPNGDAKRIGELIDTDFLNTNPIV